MNPKLLLGAAQTILGPKILTALGLVAATMIVSGIVGLAFGWLLAIGWNHSFASIFPTVVPKIGFWQAFWLQFTAGMLFKSSTSVTKSEK